MSIAILNCKSLLSKKTFLPIKIRHKFKKNILLCKIKNKKYRKEKKYNNKLQKYKKIVFNCKSTILYRQSKFPIKIKHYIFEKLAADYQITNNVILENLDFFYKMTKLYIDLYISTKQQFIKNNNEVIFTILSFYQNKINSREMYQKMKIEDIFTKELLFEIRYL